MIGTEVLTNYGRLDALSELARVYPQLPQRIGQSVLDKRKRNLLDELKFTPPAAKKPIKWTPAAVQDKPPNVNYRGERYYSKQKAAYFATDGFGGGIPSTRTNKMVDSWEVFLVTSPGGIAIRATNKQPYTQFVVGRLKPRGKDPMQQFHKITGWKPIDTTFATWAQALAEEVTVELRAFLDKRKAR